MKRCISVIIAFVLIMLSTAVFYASDGTTADLGTPQDISIIAADVEEADKFNNFRVSFSNDAGILKKTKGYNIKLDWRIRLSNVNDWYEINEFSEIENSKNTSVGLFYIQPGSVNAFKSAQPKLYSTISSALKEFTVWSGEKGLFFDRDNYSMEIQLRYRAEKSGSEVLIGKWSDSAYFGLLTINSETPPELVGAPVLNSLKYDFKSDTSCNISFTADIPQSIDRYKESMVGDVKLTAQIDFGRNGFWYNFLSNDLKSIDTDSPISADLNIAEIAKLSQYADSKFPKTTSEITSPIEVRIRCEWYAKSDDKSKDEESEPLLVTDWSELSIDVNGTSGSVSPSSKAEDDNGTSFKIILPVCIAAIAVICVAAAALKRRKNSMKRNKND